MPDVGLAEPAERPALPSILIVDDSAAKRLAIRAMLTPLGCEVVEAASGRDALRAVLGDTFAMILMDVRMPTLDGYETAKLIRERPQSQLTPIIFVTAFGGDEAETTRAYASGAVDFIFTPILPEVLRAKAAAFIDLFRQAQELKDSLASITILNAALRASEVRSQAVLQNVGDGILTAGAGGLIESFNRSAQQLLGYREDEVIGKPLELIVAETHRSALSQGSRSAWSLLDAEHIPAHSRETVGRRKDGSHLPIEMDISQTEIGSETFTIVCLRDISDRNAYQAMLEKRTLHDDLTGLPNRTLFRDRVDRDLEFAQRAGEQRAVLVVNLDKFATLNETLGREKSDALLQAIAGRLAGTMRDSDTVSRLGGDTFGILPSGATDLESAAAIAWKVRQVFDHPFLITGDALDARASVGISLFPQHGTTSQDLIHRADLAMQQAKWSGDGLAVFTADPDEQTANRLTLLNDLRAGIPRDELVLHYQPKIDLTAEQRVTGFEALVRWEHPTRGLLMPADFMPEAERSDLIEPLTTWVLNEALRQQRAWKDAGIDLTMAVNISARSLTRRTDLPETIARLTDLWGTAPETLTLELTENAMIDAEVARSLELLHVMGERLAIDDFGTGHSSLVYLQRLTVHEIKIDRSFVMNLATAEADATIVRSTIDLAHNLGLTVVAEGVEDVAAMEMLVAYGCDGAQGFLISKPGSGDAMTKWLGESPYGMAACVLR
jgi:diguanylate cyclase (GGDEF)-like protein/PAS domain S-box-containing protein